MITFEIGTNNERQILNDVKEFLNSLSKYVIKINEK